MIDLAMGMTHVLDSRAAAHWLRQREVKALCSDSRQVQNQDAFVAWPGFARDGRVYVPDALEAGACACLVEWDGVDQVMANWPKDVDRSAVACISGLKNLAGEIADHFYKHPSRDLSVIAITGTNGKTSSAWWLAQALTAAGRRCGVMGTLGVGFPHHANWEQTGLTTPDPIAIQRTLSQWHGQGVTACAIEASSIGIEEERLSGLYVRIALFTNFTQDHLDYHKTMDAYWQAKRRLFDFPSLESVVINIDDVHGQRLAAELAESRKDLSIWTYSIQSAQARLFAVNWHPTSTGLELDVRETDGATAISLSTTFVGAYNGSNLLGVLCALRALGVSLEAAVSACASLTAVPGRMESVQTTGSENMPLVLVDYAHTPDALVQALTALRPIASLRGGLLHAIVGCGGDRDPTKRPLMAQAAEQNADCIWFTSDNPRSENPLKILEQMLKGLRAPNAAHIVADRGHAIKSALLNASNKDVVLIAGKGHETTQEINGVKYPFSDVTQAQQVLLSRT